MISSSQPPIDIQTPATTPTAGAGTRMAAAEVNTLLRLLQTLPQGISEGQKLQAEIVSVRQSGQVFDVLLKMALPDGRQSTLSAQTTQAMTPGQSLTLTALGQNQLGLAQQAGTQAAMTRIDLAKIPINSLLQAKVIQVEPQPQGNFRATLSLSNTALAGQTLIIETPRALAINSTLSARVTNSSQIQFIPNTQAGERLNALQELPGQFSRQTGLGTALQQLFSVASSSSLPGDSQKIIQQLLNTLPDISQKLGTSQLAELVKNGGIQLEQRLLADAPSAAQQDLKASLLKLVGQMLPAQTGASPLLSSTQAAMLSQALPQLLREAGGFKASQIREQAMRFPLASRVLEKLDNPNDLGALLRIAAAAISRLQTHQLASLAQTYTTAEGTQVNTWQMEIPLRNQDSVIPLQVKFQQEQSAQEQQEQQPPFWRLELSFELEPLGPLHVQVNLKNNDELTSKLWAEREQTALFVNQELHVLRDKLLAAGLNIKELDCQQGIPPAAPKAILEQRWIDDLA